jgi:hypothetical protein
MIQGWWTPHSESPSVVGLVLSYNSLSTLSAVLVAARAQTVSLRSLIVVDNASTDGTRAYLQAAGCLDRALILSHNLGVGAGTIQVGDRSSARTRHPNSFGSSSMIPSHPQIASSVYSSHFAASKRPGDDPARWSPYSCIRTMGWKGQRVRGCAGHRLRPSRGRHLVRRR